MDDKTEAYARELLAVLERIATVLERFDNAMNPPLGDVSTLGSLGGLRFVGEEFPAADLDTEQP